LVSSLPPAAAAAVPVWLLVPEVTAPKLKLGLVLGSLLLAAGVEVPKLKAGLLLVLGKVPKPAPDAVSALVLLLRKPITGEELLPKGGAADPEPGGLFSAAMPAAAAADVALLSPPGLLLVVNCGPGLGEAPVLVLPKFRVMAGVGAGLLAPRRTGVWAGDGVISEPGVGLKLRPPGGAGVLPALNAKLDGVVPVVAAAAAGASTCAWMLDDKGFPKVTCPLE
jgi:hypothetical protein